MPVLRLTSGLVSGVTAVAIGSVPGVPPGRALAVQLRQSSTSRFGLFNTSECPAPSAAGDHLPRSLYWTVLRITPFLSLSVIRSPSLLKLPTHGPKIRIEAGIE